MLSLVPLVTLLGVASAHFRVLEPTWRGSSFIEPASQWIFPCANVNETTDRANRTQWPLTGGSIKINGSHEFAFTYVNLALGTNVSNFNISLVHDFNQTGAGVLCLKEPSRLLLEEGLRESNLTLDDLDGKEASIQIIQLSHGGASLYNCADIVFNRSATLLADDQCRNDTGVGGQAIGQSEAPSSTTEEKPAESTGAASALTPLVGTGVLAGLFALLL